jgi:bifunctional DNA-binding transcriptional regulator/antitoxin component of YhaV-PrlF toxin-antitoxin module
VDLAGMWALPADPAAPRSHELIRALDDKGRLMLPSAVAEAATVPAERDGALVTVFLPGSTGRPRPGFAAAALPLDARGRLTVTVGVRREAGIPDGADVFAVPDRDRGTVTLTAASRLSAGIAGLLDALRRPTVASAAHAADDASGAKAPDAPRATAPDATDPAPADAGGTGSGGRLRIVR